MFNLVELIQPFSSLVILYFFLETSFCNLEVKQHARTQQPRHRPLQLFVRLQQHCPIQDFPLRVHVDSSEKRATLLCQFLPMDL